MIDFIGKMRNIRLPAMLISFGLVLFSFDIRAFASETDQPGKTSAKNTSAGSLSTVGTARVVGTAAGNVSAGDTSQESASPDLGTVADSDGFTEIYTCEDLLSIAEDPSGSYILRNDLDMTGVSWTPVSFSGTFEGDGHVILNLKITETGADTAETYDGNMKVYDTCFAGFFDTLRGGSVTGLILLGIDIDVDSDSPCFIGGIAGYMENGTISDCVVKGSLELRAFDRMFGVGGVIGYGCGLIENTTADVTLINIDTDAANRDEEFLGGICAAGYPDINGCTIGIDGYVSDHGYVHSGGVVGMYMFYPRGKTYYGSIKDNTINGKITFFEDNTNRRAYCKELVGEIMNWDFENGRNTSDFLRDERFEYDTDLRPHSCAEPAYTEAVTAPTCDTFGYTTRTCGICGYEEIVNYTLTAHTIENWVVTKEPTAEETGIEQGDCIYCDHKEERELAKIEPTPEPQPESVPESEEKQSGGALAAGSDAVTEESGSLGWILILTVSSVAIAAIVVVVATRVRRQGERRRR